MLKFILEKQDVKYAIQWAGSLQGCYAQCNRPISFGCIKRENHWIAHY